MVWRAWEDPAASCRWPRPVENGGAQGKCHRPLSRRHDIEERERRYRRGMKGVELTDELWVALAGSDAVVWESGQR